MNEKPIVIFDLDGTLADTGPDLLSALNHCLKPEGFVELKVSHLGHIVGQGSLAMIAKAYEINNQPLSNDKLTNLHRKFLDFYGSNLAKETKLFPQVLELLDQLKSNGFELCVCTNKYEKMARKLLDKLMIGQYFSSVTGGDTFKFRKPDARHLTETMKLSDSNSHTAIMIGDTVSDSKAAKNASLPVILADFGYSEKPVIELEPDAVISSFNQCYDHIERLIGNTG